MSINILCVDDESYFGETIQRYFREHLTPNVDLAENHGSALEKILKKRYDLIILDSLEGDCFRIIEDIRETPHGDVVILSGNTRIVEEAKKRGIPFYHKSRITEFFHGIVAQYKPAAE